jgi:hypothetical protein
LGSSGQDNVRGDQHDSGGPFPGKSHQRVLGPPREAKWRPRGSCWPRRGFSVFVKGMVLGAVQPPSGDVPQLVAPPWPA